MLYPSQRRVLRRPPGLYPSMKRLNPLFYLLAVLALAHWSVANASTESSKLCHLLVGKMGTPKLTIEASTLLTRKRVDWRNAQAFEAKPTFKRVMFWQEKGLVVALSRDASQLLFFDLKAGQLSQTTNLRLEGYRFRYEDRGIDFDRVEFRFSKNNKHFFVVSPEGKVFQSSLVNLYHDRPMLLVLNLNDVVREFSKMTVRDFSVSEDGNRIFFEFDYGPYLEYHKSFGVYDLVMEQGSSKFKGEWLYFINLQDKKLGKVDWDIKMDVEGKRLFFREAPWTNSSGFWGMLGLEAPKFIPAQGNTGYTLDLNTKVVTKWVFPEIFSRELVHLPRKGLVQNSVSDIFSFSALRPGNDEEPIIVGFDIHKGYVKYVFSADEGRPYQAMLSEDGSVNFFVYEDRTDTRITAKNTLEPSSDDLKDFELLFKRSGGFQYVFSQDGQHVAQYNPIQITVQELKSSHP